MRYFEIDNISFTNSNGKTVYIKDVRPIPEYVTATYINLKNGDTLDEIASRKEIYGDGAEDQSYKIFEHNIVEICDANFDLNKLKKMKIPT